MKSASLWLFGLPMATVVACTDESKGPDAGDPIDASVLPDANDNPDAQTLDATGTQDSGVDVDSGSGDSGQGDVDGGLPEGTAPSRRGDMAYALDPVTGRTFFFHGDRAEPMMCDFPASDFLDDGWVFDPSTRRWAEIIPSGTDKPLRRARASAAWDEVGKRFILFGGRFRVGTTGSYTFMNDLWAYSPETNTWTELSPQDAPGAPKGRMNSSLVADPSRNRVIVHAGGQTDFTVFQVDTETWVFDFDTNAWQEIADTGTQPRPPGETGRLFHVAALDRKEDRMFVFAGGGRNAFNTFVGDMWFLNLVTNTWTRVDLSAGAPDPRIKSAMDYDEAHNQLVLFGGHDNGNLGNDNDLWTFDLDGLTWSRRIQGDVWNKPAIAFCVFPADFTIPDLMSPERRESHLFVIHGSEAYMYGGRTDCGLANDTWKLDLSTMTWTQLSSSFTGMTCFRSGRTDCEEPNARKCG